ncbi:MAG: hydrogen gas-evolving membrane-bound hydrogenase subunit E [Candidatus Hydrothermarchaeales archaeon]
MGTLSRRPLFALVILSMVGYLLAGLVVEMPEFGSSDAPAYKNTVPRYLSEGVSDTGATNIVTSILFDYRAYDTLGEATVLFAAVLAILSLMGGGDDP